MSNLTAGLAKYWQKEFLVRATGDKQINEWLSSKEYKALWKTAEAMLPPSGKYDRRTKAYKYMHYHEPRARKKWNQEQGIDLVDDGSDTVTIRFRSAPGAPKKGKL